MSTHSEKQELTKEADDLRLETMKMAQAMETVKRDCMAEKQVIIIGTYSEVP